ncbi:MAG: GAF domain-containing sensor histidine kinase [Candidatus Omnitrophica bacterium]|nr:GAF domain-containing sensor histidine kinase [Candidatus Omnitrophota bacterium]
MVGEPSRAEFKYLVERQREEIRTINEVGRLLRTSNDPRELVRLVASYLRQTFPLVLCGVLLLEEKVLQVIRFAKIAQVDAANAIRELCTKTGEGFPAGVKEEEFSRTEEDRSGDPGQWSQSSAAYLRASHFVPLTFNGKAMGRLGLFTPKEGGFTRDDQHVFAIVADQLAAALHNAFLLEELRKADRMKNELLAVISHELRIPLTAIQEGSSLLAEGVLGPLNDEQSDFLKTVQRNAKRLQTLIEKVELASHLIAGKVAYEFKEADASEVLKKVEESFRPLAEQKKVALEVSGGRAACSADARLLSQALAQIVENGIQATPEGGKVTAACSETAQGIEIRITDTGRGIPPEEMPRQFGQFSSIGGINERKTGGMGLGLFMAHRILDAHHGGFRLESEPGKGTRVVVTLPKQQPK